jgi:ribosomal protein S18 acetylase RimI-like enzyme
MAIDAAWIEHGRDMTTLIRMHIKDALEHNLARRIETVTLPERSRARAWYEKLGLKFESTLPGYCADGADGVLYVAERG